MSENTEAPENDQEPQTEIEAPEVEATAPTTEPADDGKGKEAAKYRRRLRETETERDQLNTQLEAARTELVKANLAGSNTTADAVFAAGYTVNDFLDADGALDSDKLDEAAADTRERFNIRTGPRSDSLSKVNAGNVPSTSTWADALKG